MAEKKEGSGKGRAGKAAVPAATSERTEPAEGPRPVSWTLPTRTADEDYDGVHVFVFVDHVDGPPTNGLSNAVEELSRIPEVRFAARMLGPYPLFAHLRSDDVRGMLDLIDGPLWRAGVRCSYAKETSVTVVSGLKKGTKRGSPGAIALTRIWMEPSSGQDDDVESLLQALPGLVGPAFKGASAVAGDFDILLQLGHEDDVDLVLHAASRVRRFPGVGRTETSLTEGDG
jgi:hypothetical protein